MSEKTPVREEWVRAGYFEDIGSSLDFDERAEPLRCGNVSPNMYGTLDVKISERFELDATQFELDFVDIDTDRDTQLYLDPYFLGCRNDPWSINASRTVRSFFAYFIELVRMENAEEARRLFSFLSEPNETCLGMSSGAPHGAGIGRVKADDLYDSIVESNAIETGVVGDLEDVRLFIRGIDKDNVSDMTTNIIRRSLIDYTQNQCILHNIPLQNNVASGPYWNRANRRWESSHEDMLVIDGRRILLVPKGVVSLGTMYATQKYHGKFVLEFLQDHHLTMRSIFVDHRKDGTPFVTKKILTENVAPRTKEFLAQFTEQHPTVFQDFKEWVAENAKSLQNEDLTSERRRNVAEYLIQQLRDIPPGTGDATRYHKLGAGILEFLLYPHAISPQIEREVNQGRKRIDLTFDNAATTGLLYRMHSVHNTPSSFLMVEFKNYSREIANPEVDQMIGRLDVNRGKFGLIVCRAAENMERLIQRCRDAHIGLQGSILPLVDDDLIHMLQLARDGVDDPAEELLSDRYRDIALG